MFANSALSFGPGAGGQNAEHSKHAATNREPRGMPEAVKNEEGTMP